MRFAALSLPACFPALSTPPRSAFMSQVLAYFYSVALPSLPIEPLRELAGSLAAFTIGAGIALYAFHFRRRRGSRAG